MSDQYGALAAKFEAELAKLRSALDEARASLARVTEQRDDWIRERQKEADARFLSTQEAARLREVIGETYSALCKAGPQVADLAGKGLPYAVDALTSECARLREEGAALRASIAERARPDGSEAMCAARVSGCTCRWPVTLCASPSCPLHGMERAPSPKKDAPRCGTCRVCRCRTDFADPECPCPCHGTGRSPSTERKDKP